MPQDPPLLSETVPCSASSDVAQAKRTRSWQHQNLVCLLSSRLPLRPALSRNPKPLRQWLRQCLAEHCRNCLLAAANLRVASLVALVLLPLLVLSPANAQTTVACLAPANRIQSWTQPAGFAPSGVVDHELRVTTMRAVPWLFQ